MDVVAIDVRDENQNAILEWCSGEMSIGANNDVSTTVHISFFPSQSPHRGELYFNHSAFVSCKIENIGQGARWESIKKRRPSYSIGDQTDGILQMTMQYKFEETANTNIGIDSEFEPLLNYLMTEKPLIIYVAGPPSSLRRVQTIIEKVRTEKSASPYAPFFSSGKVYCDKTAFRSLDEFQYPTKPVAACMTFHNKDDYLFTQSVASQVEQENIERKTEDYCKRKQKLVVVEIPERGDKEYLVFLQAPLGNEARLEADNMVKILLPGRKNLEKAWVMTVSAPLPKMPYGFVVGHMSRPWVYSTGLISKLVYDDYDLKVEKAEQPRLDKLVQKAKGMMVDVDIHVDETLHRRRLKCMRYMSRGVYDDPMTTAIEKLLVAHSLHDLPSFDVFRTVREEFNDAPESLIKGLNESQQSVVDMCRHAPGGVVTVQGPPGTGKTHLIVNLTTPYIMSKSRHKVLMTTQTNIGTDNLAVRCQQHIDSLQSLNPDSAWLQNKFVVRAHVSTAEMNIYTKQKKPQSKATQLPADSKTLTAAHTEARKGLEVVKSVFENYRLHMKKLAKPRGAATSVQEIELSLAHRMLQVANILETGPKHEHDKHFQPFRVGYEKWRTKKAIDDDEVREIWKSAEELRKYVLQNATIVCTTITNAGSETIYGNMAGITDLIIADEMPRCLESDALMLFMGGIQPAGYIVVGDINQLGPFVASRNNENAFSPQLGVSVQERLQRAGFPTGFLDIQYRMDPRLAKDTSDIVYQSRLKNHPSTEDRELALQLDTFNETKFGLSTNKLVLDISPDPKNGDSVTAKSSSGSRYNEHHVMHCFNLAAELSGKFSKASIAILTGYTQQFNLFRRAKQKMAYERFHHENIHIHKVDTVQGLEFDFVILDFLIFSRGSLGFLGSMNRLNVATSRAKHGMYVVVDHAAYRKTDDSKNEHVHEFMARWPLNTDKIDNVGVKCEWYTPGYVD